MFKCEYKVIQENNTNTISGELTKLGTEGWKVILLTSTFAGNGQGIGQIVLTVILEHEIG